MSNSNSESFSIQGYNLVTLLKRLETATARLEDVTIFQEQRVSPSKTISPATATTAAIAAAPSLPATTTATGNPTPTTPLPPQAAAVEQTPKSVEAFDELIKQYVTPLADLSKDMDTVLSHQTQLLLSAFEKEKDVIKAALKSKQLKPEDADFQNAIINPINSIIMKIIEIKDGNRTHPQFNALNALAEGVAVLGWVCVPTPISYIPEFKDSAQFWTNRVLKDHKTKAGEGDEVSKQWVEWVKLYLSVFDELKAYVKEWATTGLVFKGDQEFLDAIKEKSSSVPSSAPAPPSAGGPPPPPPPPPADLFDNLEKPTTSESNGGGMGAVFAQLSKGEGVTAGLKKVDKSQMTHKNPELRKKSVPQPPKKPQSLSTAKPEVKAADKPAKKELQDNKWMILNQVDAGLIEIEVSMDQSVFIGNCVGTIVKLTGKVNAVSVNNCNKVGVVIDRAVSSVELNKCKSCEVQVMEWVPVMSIDQSESISLYLTGPEASNVELYSSGTTALNVNLPTDDDTREFAVAEQFKTTIIDGKLVTVAVNGE